MTYLTYGARQKLKPTYSMKVRTNVNKDGKLISDPNQFDLRKTTQLLPEDNVPIDTPTFNQASVAPVCVQGQHNEQERKLKVFISYAHEDQGLRKKLGEHLITLEHCKNIEIWHDQEIPPGADWRDHINTNLNEADMILLLVSSSFIASNYCWNEEVLTALQRHNAKTARVVPIILRPVRWQNTPLEQLQVLPTGARPVTKWDDVDTALEDVIQGIERAVEDLLQGDNHRTRKIRELWALFIHKVKKVVPMGDPGKGAFSSSFLLIGALPLIGYLLSVGLDLLNISLPSWMSYVAPILVIPFVLLLFVESRKAQTGGMSRERRAFLTLSAITIGFLALGNFVQKMGQLNQLRMGLTRGRLRELDAHRFGNAVSNVLDIPVSSTFCQTYGDTIKALGNGDVEIAWLGPLAYLRAHQIYGARPFVCNSNLSGKNTYNSYIIASARANIRQLDDLKGSFFALADENSTSGMLIPLAELKQANIDPGKDIRTAYVGAQNVLDNVLNGTYPAGAVSSDDYDDALRQGKFHQNDLVILQKSRDIPQGPFVVRKDIQHYDELRIQDAFFTAEERNLPIVNALSIGGFAKVEHENYEFLIPLANDLGIDLSVPG
jgi:phosphonate transport system substrate-binding protein